MKFLRKCYKLLRMEATALHDFHATADDELSFKKGSILKVSRTSRCSMYPDKPSWVSWVVLTVQSQQEVPIWQSRVLKFYCIANKHVFVLYLLHRVHVCATNG